MVSEQGCILSLTRTTLNNTFETISAKAWTPANSMAQDSIESNGMIEVPPAGMMPDVVLFEKIRQQFQDQMKLQAQQQLPESAKATKQETQEELLARHGFK